MQNDQNNQSPTPKKPAFDPKSIYATPDEKPPPTTQTEKAPQETVSKPTYSHLLKIAVLAIAVIYQGIFITLFSSHITNAFVLEAVLLIPVLFFIYRKIEGILLPYILSTGITFSISELLKDIPAHSNHSQTAAEIRNNIPLISNTQDHVVLLSATAIALVIAVLAYFLMSKYPRPIVNISNVFFRSLAIFLICYSGYISGSLINSSITKVEAEQIKLQQENYEKTNLSPKLNVYSFSLSGYSLEYVIPKGDGPVFDGYQLNFVSNKTSTINIEVSLQGLPKTCNNPTTTPMVKFDNSKPYSCNIVLMSKGGVAIYGSRSVTLGQMQSTGRDVSKLSAQDLRKIQPNSFFIIDSGNLITISSHYANNGVDSDPITPDFMNKLIGTMKTLDSRQREDFVSTNIKPGEPPLSPPNSNIDEYKNDVLSGILWSVIGALLTWTFEKIFQKARRAYWKVYVPIYNFWTLATIANRPGWWSIVSLPATLFVQILVLIFGPAWVIVAALFSIINVLIVISFIQIILIAIILMSLGVSFGRSYKFSIMLAIPALLSLISSFSFISSVLPIAVVALGLLLLVPSLVCYLILGFGKSKYIY